MKIMKLKIKVLKGGECEVEVSEQGTVLDVKQEVASKLGIDVDQQRLMSKGKALADTSKLTDCGLSDNSKLFVSLKPAAAAAAPTNSATEQLDFWKELHTFYKSHFNEEQSQQMLECFKQEFHRMTNALSLDDLERIAAAYLSETG